MRAFAFSKWLSVPKSSVLATLVFERLLYFMSLLISLSLAFVYLRLTTDNAGTLLSIVSSALFVVAAIAALIIGFPQLFQLAVMFSVRLLASVTNAVGQGSIAAVENLLLTMRNITRSGQKFGLVALAILAWAAEAMVFFCAALAVPGLTDSQAAWLAMPVGTLSTLLPSSPGYLGAFHYFIIEATTAVGNASAAAAAFAVAVHLVLWVTATNVGGACFEYWNHLRMK